MPLLGRAAIVKLVSELFHALSVTIWLVDERQAASLDEMIEVTPQTQVIFLRLVPLVGG